MSSGHYSELEAFYFFDCSTVLKNDHTLVRFGLETIPQCIAQPLSLGRHNLTYTAVLKITQLLKLQLNIWGKSIEECILYILLWIETLYKSKVTVLIWVSPAGTEILTFGRVTNIWCPLSRSTYRALMLAMLTFIYYFCCWKAGIY